MELTPGRVNQIVGKNGQGKSSVLKALEVALRGANDGSLVKRGEDSAEIIVEFDNALIVRRRLKNDGTSSVTVKKDGFTAQKPQGMLDGLLSEGGFNPLDLLDPKTRTANLLKAIELKVTEQDIQKRLEGILPVSLPPLDYSQHGLKVVEQAHRYFYQRRAEANKDFLAKNNRFTALQQELPASPVALTADTREEIQGKIAACGAAVAEETKKKSLQTERQEQLEKVKWGLQSYLDEKEKVANQIHQFQMKLAQSENQIEHQQSLVASAEQALKEVAVDQDKIDRARNETIELQKGLTVLAEIQAHDQRRKVVEEASVVAASALLAAEELDKCVQALGSSFKSQLMSRTALPIEGLAYENEQFLLGGFAIDNLATSKALRLAVGIARKLAGPAKLICIDGAELLDQESYSALRSEIDGDGFTYFLTCVGDAFESSGDKVFKMENGAAQVLQ